MWLDESAERVASVAPTGAELESSEVKEEAEVSFMAEDSSLMESVGGVNEGPKNLELIAAIQAERHGLGARCRKVASWTYSRLEQMRSQYDEIFKRMDDWIKNRVKEENEAIKETEQLLRSGHWQDEEEGRSLSRSTTLRKSHTGHLKPALSSAAGKRRRDVLKVIVPKTLDVDVYSPPELFVTAASRPGTSASGARPVSRQSGNSRRPGPVLPERWTQEMLWGLLARLSDLEPSGICQPQLLRQVLLERRHAALGFENEQVLPVSWVQRPLVVYHLLCRTMLEPAWGAAGVDVTEFLLALTHHENWIAWPNREALEATREYLHSEDAMLEEEQLSMSAPKKYPDVPVSEELFSKLPLWPAGCRPELRTFMFHVLCCFAEEGAVRLPPKPGREAEGRGPISARRIFSYFGLGNTPAATFSQQCRLLLPASCFSEDPPPQVLVKDLWTILYSQKSRPATMIAPVPDLATFCNSLLEEGKVPEPVPKAKAKAKGKAKQEVEEEVEPPPVPEEATVAFSESVLLQRQTVLKALCSHGGLLCRRRNLEELFPNPGVFPLKTAAEAAAQSELASLIPAPVEEAQEDPPP
ncbi:unnamed protein product [Effrenium voratum]|nr:unnamed protein product [Effrenium voratum]